MTDIIGAPPEQLPLDAPTATVLRARHIAVLDQDTEWCSRAGTVLLADMTGHHARHVVAFLQRQATLLCMHYWSHRIRQLAPDGDLSDGKVGELQRLGEAAQRAAQNPRSWLDGTTLMRRLIEIAARRCWCGGDVGQREPGDALGLGCLDDITHNWHPYDDHPFTGSSIGFGCARMVTDADGHGTDCGLPANHPVHLTPKDGQ